MGYEFICLLFVMQDWHLDIIHGLRLPNAVYGGQE